MKKNGLTTLALALYTAFAAQTQNCLPDGIFFFFSQQEVNAFPANYPGCKVIEGSVIIFDFNPPIVTNSGQGRVFRENCHQRLNRV